MWKRYLLRLSRWPRSIKSKLIVVLLLSSLIPLTFIGTISYYTIYSILDNKIEAGVRNDLNQVKLSLSQSLDLLNKVSQQLSFDGSVGLNMRNYLTTDELYKKKQYYDDIVKDINLISFTNPTLALIYYYMPDNHKVLFSNYDVSDHFDLGSLPILADYSALKGFTYLGPHRTIKKNHGNTVLSLAREVQILEGERLYIFVETEVENVLGRNQIRTNTSNIIVDSNGIIAYSDNMRKDYRVGKSYLDQNHQPYYLFEDQSDQGWKVTSIIPKSEYNREINLWLFQFFVVTVSSLGISLMFAWVIWRTVYRPLKSLNSEIVHMSKSNFHSHIKFTKVKEFDFLLRRFQDMRQKVWELLNEVKVKEKRKASLEVEKLLYQINPHFIHNTLDTIRWLARLSGQDEIDRLISTLNKVLYYNLGKGKTAIIEDEIEALKNYVSLQQIRYNFQFDVRFATDPNLHNALIPRFILQPLVENALYHGGMMDDGVIHVKIIKDSDTHMLLQVIDNGSGMEDVVIQQLLNNEPEPDHKKSGLGIGLNYVKRMIQDQFGEHAQFHIKSGINIGTQIMMRLPLQERRLDSDESPGSR
ncbi:two-component system, sensor histidine kinase YesM [Paenibacillus sp. 1_12]|uniref:sensor histidine kinase n=1 Tax=Paenibacillus sp. 1_12 TaxID=1566278 RepID=UPI0008EAEF44|nr:histidine kinase [Paenibacillus sp. 1_12]SFL56279.1 two-component system, sensor histidine kinase YesM [Paenibacillus sp. 1_12]